MMQGSHAAGFEPLARAFEKHLERGIERGAALTVYHRGERVVHLTGGLASHEGERPQAFGERTRVVLFSVTKGLAAMGLSMLADRGKLDFDAPVATYWPGFARGGKGSVTVAQLLSHRAGLPVLDAKFALADHLDPSKHDAIVDALEAQRPAWEPGTAQGYHATTFGMYASELFTRASGEPLGPFLSRELFEPLGADVSLGTPEREDARIAALRSPSLPQRFRGMTWALARRAAGREEPLTEWRVLGDVATGGLARLAFAQPSVPRGIESYDDPSVWRVPLAWASATGSADGVARAYLPFALGGVVDGRRYLSEKTLEPLRERRELWRDRVLQKPIGWVRGFMKEEPHLFSPVRESFGHSGIGGSLGWCDPVNQLTFGYVLNALDWHVRSPRAVALCRALYECEPLRS
jgi:CubicO group peptidase (beta-lactamase class C family)